MKQAILPTSWHDGSAQVWWWGCGIGGLFSAPWGLPKAAKWEWNVLTISIKWKQESLKEGMVSWVLDMTIWKWTQQSQIRLWSSFSFIAPVAIYQEASVTTTLLKVGKVKQFICHSPSQSFEFDWEKEAKQHNSSKPTVSWDISCQIVSANFKAGRKPLALWMPVVWRSHIMLSLPWRRKKILPENSHDNLEWSLASYHYSPTLAHPFWQAFVL